MLRDFTWTEKYEEAMSYEHPLITWNLLLVSILSSITLKCISVENQVTLNQAFISPSKKKSRFIFFLCLNIKMMSAYFILSFWMYQFSKENTIEENFAAFSCYPVTMAFIFVFMLFISMFNDNDFYFFIWLRNKPI